MNVNFGLVSYKFINNDVEFNINQIQKAIKKVSGVDMICFGEAFLQGFDAFNWEYSHDKDIAITQDSKTMKRLEEISFNNKVDLGIGYLEKDEDKLYCSYAIIIDGKLKYNYRRISKGWKDFRKTDYHYQEGNETLKFNYKGLEIVVALCGDLWDFPDKFKAKDLLIWPIYANFTLKEWTEYEVEYAEQAYKVASKTVMINSLSCDPKSYGASFYFEKGKVVKKLEYDQEGILVINI